MNGGTSFGKTLKILRLKAGLSQNELAEKLGINNSYLSRIEGGERKPSIKILRKLSEILPVKYESLMVEAGILPKGDEDLSEYPMGPRSSFTASREGAFDEISAIKEQIKALTDEMRRSRAGQPSVPQPPRPQIPQQPIRTEYPQMPPWAPAAPPAPRQPEPPVEYYQPPAVRRREVPVYTTIPAGPFKESNVVAAYEDIEKLVLAEDELNYDDQCFGLVIQGDSMIDAGMLDGDVVIISPRTPPRNGDIAVVQIDQGETTVKKVYFQKDSVLLQACNPRYKPLPLYKKHQVQILGKVILVRRKLM